MLRQLSLAHPIAGMAKPGEITRLATYWCSDLAGFLSGADIPFDGGVQNLRG
jgi:hypothetical protein